MCKHIDKIKIRVFLFEQLSCFNAIAYTGIYWGKNMKTNLTIKLLYETLVTHTQSIPINKERSNKKTGTKNVDLNICFFSRSE
jgi:hypothetical protein